MGYKKTALIGIAWIGALRFSTRIFSFFKLIFIARILTPSDIGIFSIASLTLSFLELLTETGVIVVLIQSKKNLTQYVSSAWIASIIRGIVLTFLLIIIAPFISNFFSSPKSLGILFIISFAPLLRGFINPSVIIFQKELKFNYEFLFKTIVYAAEFIITITLLVLTRSITSLVWGMLVGIIIEVTMSFIFISPRPKLNFDSSYLSEIFHKGKWVTLYGILNYFAQVGDNIAVGKFLGAGPLGIYQMAYKLSTLTFTEITEVVSKVFFPIYTQIAEDRDRLKKVFLKSTFALSMIVIPTSLIIFFYSKEIVLLALGDKWIGAVPVLRILAFYGMARAIVSYPSSLFLALNHQKYIVFTTFVRVLTLAVTIVPFILLYGLAGAGYSVIISILAEIPIILYFAFKVFQTE